MIPFLDLRRIHQPIKKEILEKLSEMIDSSAFVMGPEVEAFEKDFAQFVGAKYCIGVSSGYDALRLALQSLGIGPGDEVITAANTFIATAYAVSNVGAKLVLADVEENSRNIDPKEIEKLINDKTRAIIPVHLYGQPATMDGVLKLAQKHKLSVVEDSAQAHGAVYQKNKVGTFGDLGCFSFYPGKNLGAMGEGGAVTTSNEDLVKKLKMYRDVGQTKKYHHEVLGQNARLHAFQAAILRIKLRGLDQQNQQRQNVAKIYNERLSQVKGVNTADPVSDRSHVYHLYVLETESEKVRDELREHLNKNEIQSGLHYPNPIHLQPCYQHLGLGEGAFPIAERLSKNCLSLPIFPGMTDQEAGRVVDVVAKFYT